MSAGLASRDAALAAVDENCPRCGSPRDAESEYCADCGLRLPAVRGAVPLLRRHWLRRVGWYPGDWIWMSMLTFGVAAAGAAGSIVVTRDRAPGHTPTFVATAQPTTTAATTTTQATTPVTTTGNGKPPTKPVHKPKPPVVPNGRLHWPAQMNGWTVILGSFPNPRARPAARAAAARAAHLGLHQVGMLDSSTWPSLNPGYAVVFSGIYRTAAEAQASLARVRHAGFGGAYPRQIAR